MTAVSKVTDETSAADAIAEAGLDVDTSDTVTREQMVAVLYSLAQSGGNDVSFDEAALENLSEEEIDAVAVEALKWAVSVGLISEAEFYAYAETLTQAQLLTILARYAAIFG